MSYYVTQLFLIKGNNMAMAKARSVIHKMTQALRLEDEISVRMKDHKVYGFHLVECVGRRTIFNNVYKILKSCGLDEVHYVDYTDGTFEGSSDFCTK